MKFVGAIAAVAAVALGLIVRDMYSNLGYAKEVAFDDAGCTLLRTPTAVEDLAPLGDGHAAFGGGGDIMTAFRHGAAAAAPGSVWLVNVTEGTARAMRIVSENADATVPKLVLHGLHYSPTSRRLYAVNHGGAEESVEVFKYTGDVLVHLTTVRSPLFKNDALNDVVEGAGEDEFYVTEWLPFGHPRGGQKSPSITLRERADEFLFILVSLLKLPLTRVFRCTHGVGGGCEVATSLRFVGANGITASRDGRRIYVNDPAVAQVTAFARGADGSLVFESRFNTKHTMDNIAMVDVEGRELLSGGSIPLLYTAEIACEAGLGGSERQVSGRTVGCGRSPGGLLLLDPRDGAVVADKVHDGSKLSGISSAVTVGGAYLLGSPSSPGILMC